MKSYFLTLLLFVFGMQMVHSHFITYELPSGRFGDQLIAYMHAKWLSYRYNIPLLYQPFIFSEELLLDEKELPYDEHAKKLPVFPIEDEYTIDRSAQKDKMLFFVRYFPESSYDLRLFEWPTFPIDWSDSGFLCLLRSHIKPKQTFNYPPLPNDRTTVAVHIRRGGGGHDPIAIQGHWPLKFVPDSFYIAQIRKMSELLGGAPLFVHLFTDDPDPAAIAQQYHKALEDLDIVFYFTPRKDSCERHVLEDLFHMLLYSCLIRADSNYSIVAEKLGEYAFVIFPINLERKGQEVLIQAQIIDNTNRRK
jgi:hypothetical protein